MATFDGVRVGASLPALGFAKAFSRWQAAQEDGDPVKAYLAVSESLEWAHALDERIARTWRPRGAVAEDPWWRWSEDPALGQGAYLADTMRGLGYVRNRIHHHFADALETVNDPTRPGCFSFIWGIWGICNGHAGSMPGIRRLGPRVCHRERAFAGSCWCASKKPRPSRSACIGIAARSEQLRRIAEGDEAFVGDPERVA